MTELFKIIISLVPVLVFLAALVLLDSYKLVPPQTIVGTILAGGAAAAASALINGWLSDALIVSPTAYSRYVAPAIEEATKAIYVVLLFRFNRIGFMVDAAICGFGVGAGFSLVENGLYLFQLATTNVVVWVIRGFGTAAMHAAATAMLAVIAKNLADRSSRARWWVFMPGLALAYVTHSFFNHFILSPTLTTMLLLMLLPLLVVMVFARSERATQEWLGIGFDSDQELIRQLSTGKFEETRIGKYLMALQTRFPAAVVVDMFCMLRLHTELALRAKGVIMMRQAGIEIPPDPELREKFAELNHLERSIGKTGKLAILPFIHTSSRDLWQLTAIR